MTSDPFKLARIEILIPRDIIEKSSMSMTHSELTKMQEALIKIRDIIDDELTPNYDTNLKRPPPIFVSDANTAPATWTPWAIPSKLKELAEKLKEEPNNG